MAQIDKSEPATKSSSPRSEFKQAINICPIAPIFGIYAINYEYLLKQSYGLVGRLEYESIPKTYTDASIESSAIAFSLNYRWHISGEMKSIFIGAYSRYRIYDGTGTLNETKFNFDLSELSLGFNAGKRWVWDSGFNATFSIGYGLSNIDRKSNPTNPSIELELDKFEEDYDFTSPLFGELSIGYAF